MNQYDPAFPKFEFRGVKSFESLHRVFVGLKDQKTETCGPYSLMKILLSLPGGWPGDLSEDRLAQLSGTLISETEWRVSQANPGAKESELEESVRQMYYPLSLAISNKEEEQGTSAEGLFHAMEKTMTDSFTLFPLPSRAGGKVQFTEEAFSALTSALWKHLPDIGVQAIFNCQMNRLCSNEGLLSFMDVIDFLNSGGAAEDEEWNVGHFMVFAGIFSVSTSGGERRYFLMQDSYKSRGMQGYRIQPEERVRNSLVRDDGREGGIMLAVPKESSDLFQSEIGMHFSTGLWNNGTPYNAQHQS